MKRKNKLYKKRGRLFFSRPEILESLAIRVNQCPFPVDLTYLSDKDWKEYESIVGGNYQSTGYFKFNPKIRKIYHPQDVKANGILCLFYRGIPVINLKDCVKIK